MSQRGRVEHPLYTKEQSVCQLGDRIAFVLNSPFVRTKYRSLQRAGGTALAISKLTSNPVRRRRTRFKTTRKPQLEHCDLKTNLPDRNDQGTKSTTQVRFVAEVSSNHAQDLGRALQFVDRAAEIGCDGVKFQLFRINELFAPEILRQSAQHRARQHWELPEDFIAPISERCREKNLEFGCTPFFLEAVETLAPFVDFLKIASYELLWDDLLRLCAQTGLPLVLSTGMATLEEVAHATKIIHLAGGRDLTLLHCISGYPAPAAEANLLAMTSLRDLSSTFTGLDIRVGWSDHTVEPGVIQRAVHAHDAQMIEFHLDLEGEGAEFESGHCWLPDAMRETIQQIRVGLQAEGCGGKIPRAFETEERSWRADPTDGLRPLRSIRTQWSPPPA